MPVQRINNDIDIGKADPLYERQLRILRRSIEKGLLGEGLVLLEGPLAQIFGSSRMPTRRALSQLLELGLVHRFEGRGYAVGREGCEIRRAEITPDMLDLGVDLNAVMRPATAPSLGACDEPQLQGVEHRAVADPRVDRVAHRVGQVGGQHDAAVTAVPSPLWAGMRPSRSLRSSLTPTWGSASSPSA